MHAPSPAFSPRSALSLAETFMALAALGIVSAIAFLPFNGVPPIPSTDSPANQEPLFERAYNEGPVLSGPRSEVTPKPQVAQVDPASPSL